MDSTIYWIWLTEALGYCCPRVYTLSRQIAPKELYRADWDQLMMQGTLTPKENKKLNKTPLDHALRIWEHTQRKGIRVLTPEDADYPPQLLEIYSVPGVLYVLGDASLLRRQPAMAMVGTRDMTPYGRRVAQEFSGALAQAGFTIVSGLALGVDTVCHTQALKVGGKTIGVLGCGIDRDYPPSNRLLKELMVQYGAVISEFPPDAPPLAGHFPLRNRIISGLSQGVLVVEAGVKSGSLITAGHGLTQGKDIFAVPGEIFQPTSQGTIKLIRQGAIPVSCVEDILQEYRDRFPLEALPVPDKFQAKRAAAPQEPAPAKRPQAPAYLTEDQKRIFQVLTSEPKHMDQIVLASGLGVGQVMAALTELETYCLVKSHANRHFSLSTGKE